MSACLTAASIIVNKGPIRVDPKASLKDTWIVNVSLRCLKSLWGGWGESKWKWQGTPCPAYFAHGKSLRVEVITETELKFLFFMYILPQETFNFEVCSRGKTELSTGAPSITKKIYIWKGLLGVCLHLTFKQDDGKYPDDQQEVISSHFISAAH